MKVGKHAFSMLFFLLQELWEPYVENGRDTDQKTLGP